MASEARDVHGTCAPFLQPSIAPGAEDLQQPLEAQGRGFAHRHGKSHSRVGAEMRLVRVTLREQGGQLLEAVKFLRRRLLCAAATVQYESAREPGLQLGVSVAPEPFTDLQQRQSRMDGGCEDDGTRRDHVPVAPPFIQPHIAAEQRLAAAQGREARVRRRSHRMCTASASLITSTPA